MKVFRWFILLTVLVMLAFAAAPALAQGGDPVEPPASELAVPPELQALIAAGIGYLVTQGLKSLSKLFHKDISGWGAVLTASVVTCVIYFFNALLSAVPENAVQIVSVGLTLLVAILSAFGVHYTFKGFQPLSTARR